MFATKEDIQTLTGYKYPARQIQWLKAEGFKFKVAADGRPIVLISEIERLMGSGEPKKKTVMPNFDCI